MSRRSFVASALVGTAGYWACCSNQLGARVLRGLVVETGRGIAPAKFLPDPSKWPANGITAAWLGHSTVLLNFYGVNILTDPVLFRRVGVDLRLGTVGPKRLVAPALSIEQLPPIDLVLLSHAHMDHFDLPTLRCLPSSTHAVTARATRDLFPPRLRHVHELGWGEKKMIKTLKGEVEVSAFEVRHWGARWRRDSYRGYAGYVVARGGKKMIFGGDTAFSENFRELGSAGPYELAIMPIGAYQPWVISHCTPEQAVAMTDAAGAGHLLPIHYRTFSLGQEGPNEPIERLQVALDKQRIGWREIGETWSAKAS